MRLFTCSWGLGQFPIQISNSQQSSLLAWARLYPARPRMATSVLGLVISLQRMVSSLKAIKHDTSLLRRMSQTADNNFTSRRKLNEMNLSSCRINNISRISFCRLTLSAAQKMLRSGVKVSSLVTARSGFANNCRRIRVKPVSFPSIRLSSMSLSWMRLFTCSCLLCSFQFRFQTVNCLLK